MILCPNPIHLYSSAPAVMRYQRHFCWQQNVFDSYSWIVKLVSYLLLYAHHIQVVYADVYMLDEEMKWKTLPPMPKPNIQLCHLIQFNFLRLCGLFVTNLKFRSRTFSLVASMQQFLCHNMFQKLFFMLWNKC